MQDKEKIVVELHRPEEGWEEYKVSALISEGGSPKCGGAYRTWEELTEEMKSYFSRLPKIEKKEEIRVPDSIKFVKSLNSFSAGLVFNEGKQQLYSGYEDLLWVTLVGSECYSKQPKLIKCERSELKVGDWAFRSEEDSPDFKKKEGYSLILDGEKYVFTQSNDIFTRKYGYKNWWKVVFD